MSNASGGSGEYVIHGGGSIPPPRTSAMMFAMTVTVKAIDSHRWVCRINAFHFKAASSNLLGRGSRCHSGIPESTQRRKTSTRSLGQAPSHGIEPFSTLRKTSAACLTTSL